MGGGVGGFCAGGPPGAVAGGVAAGAGMDLLTTGVDSAVHRKYKPSGLVAMGENCKNGNPAGQIFDICCTVVGDGITGRAAGMVYESALAPPAEHAGQTLPNGDGRYYNGVWQLDEDPHLSPSMSPSASPDIHLGPIPEPGSL